VSIGPISLRPCLALAAACAAALAPAPASAHDMFLKALRFRLPAPGPLELRVVNGTFTRSENTIDVARLAAVPVVGPAGRRELDRAAWRADGTSSAFTVEAGEPGSWVLGVSTRPSVIALTAREFEEYLASDGLPDVLGQRRRNGESGRAVKERYEEHVKALVQVGDRPGEGFATPLGSPVEIVPLDDPYALRPGAAFRFRALVDGAPAPGQLVQFGGRTATGGRIPLRSLRTGADGIGRIVVAPAGTWYVKFIHMRRLEGDPEADYHSRWASLSFEVR
jgi:hypothetical protein